MTATAVAWDEDHELELKSALATLSRFADYRVESQWDTEAEGANNPLWAGAGVIPGVDEGSDEWRRRARVRYWWQAIREEHGLTVAEAAGEIGVHKATLSKWETGVNTPDDRYQPAYRFWLEEKQAELVAHFKNQIIDLATLREGWPESPAGVERDVLLEEFSRVGGWWDQWRRTGILPNTRR